MNVRLLSTAFLACTLGATASCSQSASRDPASANPNAASHSTAANASADWENKGSTACQQYLTPEFVGQIVDKPSGQSERLSDASCSFRTSHGTGTNVTIILIGAGASAFDGDPNTQGGTPLTGIGDKAMRTHSGIEAYKSQRGICQIDVSPPFGNKLKDDALAQKLGEVCNKLVALP